MAISLHESIKLSFEDKLPIHLDLPDAEVAFEGQGNRGVSRGSRGHMSQGKDEREDIRLIGVTVFSADKNVRWVLVNVWYKFF